MEKLPKIFVLDTNVILHDHNSIYKFQENDLVIPVAVLEELDKFKKGNDIINFNAREFVRSIDDVSNDSRLFDRNGFPLGKGLGHLSIELNHPFPKDLEGCFKDDIQDHRILATTIWVRNQNPNRIVGLVTKDVNLRMKAKALHVMAQDYLTDHIKEDHVAKSEQRVLTVKGLPDSMLQKIASTGVSIDELRYKRPACNQLYRFKFAGVTSKAQNSKNSKKGAASSGAQRGDAYAYQSKAQQSQAQQNQAYQNQAYQSQAQQNQAQQGGAANQQRNTSVNQNASWGKAISSKYNWEPIDESKQPAEGISVKFTPSGVLARYDSDTNLIVPTNPQTVYGISPRNDEQVFAIDALMNQNIRLVSLTGTAGTGKTLLALASALAQADLYDQIILSRPVIPLQNQEIGFLPGNANEKIGPYMLPLYDNLAVIKKNFGLSSKENVKIEEMLKTERLVISPLAYIRGRSLSKVFFIVDEAQNLTPHEVKTIITRAGEGTKIVFTGDIQQIDQPYLDKWSNGLTHIGDKLYGERLFEHINLMRGERSELSELAGKKL